MTCRYHISVFMIVAFMMQGLIGMAQRNNAKGDKYFNQNQFDQALKYYLFDSKARKRIVSEYAQLKVADCYRIMGEFDKAEEAYKKIQKRKKKDPTSYLNYGLSLKSSSKYAEAKVQFQEYITLNPSDLRGPLFLASCDSAQEWLDETIGREVKNIEKKQQLNTEELFWTPNTKKIFTEKFVTIRLENDEILYGTGLDAAQDLSTYTITKPEGEFDVKE